MTSCEENKILTNRRSFIITSIATASAITLSAPVIAYVYEDPDRYGDKELKVSTVNKLRQNIRNIILSDPKLGGLFLKLAIQDAITYNAETGEGGPNGNILEKVLSKDAPESLLELKDAAKVLKGLSSTLKRYEITIADIVSFAGSEAIETAGGPRAVIQLGKLDPEKRIMLPNEYYPNLCGQGSDVVKAFKRAGLSERDVALLYGALGSMEGIASSSMNKINDIVEEEENEMGDKEISIPTSFGGPKEIYGKQMGKINTDFLKQVTNDVKLRKKSNLLMADVFYDEKVANYAIKYSENSAGFLKDLPESYARLMKLGTRYTGGKIGNLLGGQEKVIDY